MKNVKLTKQVINNIFETCKDPATATSRLYNAVIPKYNKVSKVGHYPIASKSTALYIYNKFIELEDAHPSGCLAGGLWMNLGFSIDNNVKDFIVKVDINKVIYQ